MMRIIVMLTQAISQDLRKSALVAVLKSWPNASEMSGHTISSLDEGQYNQVVLKATEQRGLIENKSLGFENEYKAAEKHSQGG